MKKIVVEGFFLFVFFFICMAAVQFSTPDIPDNDGFYHIRLAWLMRTVGLKPDFQWLPISILGPDDFYDHHFLFHVALFPFTFGDLRQGAKWSAVFFSSLAFVSVWYLMRRNSVPAAWLWAIGLIGISSGFLYRMSVPRAQSFSVLFLMVALLLLFEEKYLHLMLLSFFYVWTYDAFPLIILLALYYSVALWFSGRRLDLRPVWFAGGGVFLGLIVNPYFPENLVFTYHHIAAKLINATEIRVGNEWYPYTIASLWRNAGFALAVLLTGCAGILFSKRRNDPRVYTLFFAAVTFFFMLLTARRFVEYFPPFALVFTAFGLGSWLLEYRRIPIALLSLFVIASSVFSLKLVLRQISTSKPFDLYHGASAWLQGNSPPGSLVFQTDWDDFPRLFYFNQHNTYLIGLDPTYMQLYDPSLYNLWVMISNGGIADPAYLIQTRFNASYVHSDLNHTRFITKADDDPGLEKVYLDDQAVIYRVLPYAETP